MLRSVCSVSVKEAAGPAAAIPTPRAWRRRPGWRHNPVPHGYAAVQALGDNCPGEAIARPHSIQNGQGAVSMNAIFRLALLCLVLFPASVCLAGEHWYWVEAQCS